MRRPNRRISLHFLNMPDSKITHANALCFTYLIELLQCLPNLRPRLLSAVRTVYQEAIHIAICPVDLLHADEALLDRLCKASACGEDFGCDEDVGALETRLAHRSPDPVLGIIVVVLRRVNMAVARFEGGGAQGNALTRRGLVDTESKPGNLRGAFGHLQLVGDGEFGRNGCGGI